MWTKPAATEMRFGFEVTMYVMNKNSLTELYRGSFGSLFAFGAAAQVEYQDKPF